VSNNLILSAAWTKTGGSRTYVMPRAFDANAVNQH
jgi:hypothetical protein